jgi:hypothetical protein
LTFGQLKQAIKDNAAESLTLGIGARGGFDSFMFLSRAAVVEGSLYLLTKSYIPSRSLQRNGVIMNLKAHPGKEELYEPKANDILKVQLPDDAPVWIGVRKNFSWKGEMILFSVEHMGPSCLVSIDPSKSQEDKVEDYEVYHEVGQLSVWGEQFKDQPKP